MNNFYDARYLSTKETIFDLYDKTNLKLKSEYVNKKIKLQSKNTTWTIIINELALVGRIYDPDLEISALDVTNGIHVKIYPECYDKFELIE